MKARTIMKIGTTMKARTIVGLFVSTAVCAAYAGADYRYDSESASQRTLYVTVASGEATFDATKMTLAGASVTNLVKRGDGTLYLPNTNNLSSLTFDIHIEDGIFKTQGPLPLGTAAGSIEVSDGATLWNCGWLDGASLGDRMVRVRGTGHNGMGALYKNGPDYGTPWGHIELLGDTKAVGTHDVQSSLGKTSLRGYTLDLTLAGLSYMYYAYNVPDSEPGHIVWRGSGKNPRLLISGWTQWNGTADNTFSVTNLQMQWQDFRPYLVNYNWTLRFLQNTSLRIVDGTLTNSTVRNRWQGPIEIVEDRLPIVASANSNTCGAEFLNKVSGGGFAFDGTVSSPIEFQLSNSANDFTNGIVGAYTKLNLPVNGALPENGGSLTMTNSSVVFSDGFAYALPEAELSGDSTVEKGTGNWKRLRKSGEGKLNYASTLGATKGLELSGGSFKFDMTNRFRNAHAGLVEGRRYLNFADTADYRTYALVRDKSALETNRVTTGMTLMYDKTKDRVTGWTTNTFFTYSGYIWNNAPTNQVWSFAGQNLSDWRLDIDGKLVTGRVEWYGQTSGINISVNSLDLVTNTVVMTPGPHRFEYRTAWRTSWGDTRQGLGYCNKSTLANNGSFKGSDEQWNDVWGLGYNDTGVCSRQGKDYKKLVDPGDGSLFTYDLPSAQVTKHPVSGEEIVIKPDIPSVKGAAGTVMDLGGINWMFADITDYPSFENGDVAVTNAWLFNGENVGPGAFTVKGSLTFGPEAKIVVTDVKPPKAYRSGEMTLGTALGGIVGSPKIVCGNCWKAWVEDNSIKATYIPSGMAIIIR